MKQIHCPWDMCLVFVLITPYRLIMLLYYSLSDSLVNHLYDTQQRQWGESHILWYFSKGHILSTILQSNLKWQRNIKWISWILDWERPNQELRNERPLDSLEKPSPNSFVASLWIESGAGWPLKGLAVTSLDHQVGVDFEALNEGIFIAPSKSVGYFLPFQVALKYGVRCTTWWILWRHIDVKFGSSYPGYNHKQKESWQ